MNIETPINYDNGDYATLEVLGYTVVVDKDTDHIFAILGAEHLTSRTYGLIVHELERMRDEAKAEIRRTGMGWVKP